MDRLKKRNKIVSISGRLLVVAGLLMAVFWGCGPEPTRQPSPAQPPRAERAAAVVEKIPAKTGTAKTGTAKTDAKKPNLYGLPIVISFPDMPEVPEKIKAPKPTAGGSWKPPKPPRPPATNAARDVEESR